ncbi:hypothetical protein GH733_004013 [Mirounga leonina]|nr:hypothetical protein GH733_004013 [Mirounga leonina]
MLLRQSHNRWSFVLRLGPQLFGTVRPWCGQLRQHEACCLGGLSPEPAVQPAHDPRAIEAAGRRGSLCCSRTPETGSLLFLPFLGIRWRVKHLGCLKPGPRAL